jgi:hypothetical protein
MILVEVQDHLGITAGSKLMATSLEVMAKSDVVIDLTVVAEDERPILVEGATAAALEHHWLGSLITETDYGQPSVAEPDPPVRRKPQSLAVRPSGRHLVTNSDDLTRVYSRGS